MKNPTPTMKQEPGRNDRCCAQHTTPSSTTKKARIREALRRPRGLNRFEAERLGDHCLNSTVAALRKQGEAISATWERVPTRHCAKGVRVLRYRAM